MSKFTQVEDHPELVRDDHSKAIINKDNGAYQKRKIERNKAKETQSKHSTIMKLSAASRRHDKTLVELSDKMDMILELLQNKRK